uniref:Uncharacterized protein n=1 Tax=Chrysodeixis chalcites nucleopolyhedrovirus TaxID=320432 RepID=T1R013_9ABAC|nr:hypothetical protein [Chrysodeixis chalcites nucleopolyhedrovirus]
MFISTEDVSRDALANLINMFAYKFITNDFYFVCTVCGYGYQQYEANVWTFRVVEKNKLNSTVYCAECAAKIDDDDEDCFKIALPVSMEDQNRFEELLDRLIECGGVWLILNLDEGDYDDNNYMDTLIEDFFKHFEVYVKKFGQTAKRFTPDPVYALDNKLCVYNSKGEHFINSGHLIDMLIDCIVDMLPETLNYYSRKNFNRELSAFKDDLMEHLMFYDTVVVLPENLHDIMPKELDILRNQIIDVYQLNADDIEEEEERHFSQHDMLKYAEEFLTSFIENQNKGPRLPNSMPFCSSAAESMYDLDQYVYGNLNN